MIPWGKPLLFGNEYKFISNALKSTWISGGEYVKKFEREFSQLIGTKYGITTSNGTTALHLALLGLGISKGDEVIVPGFTFVAPANAVIYTGGKPVYVDVDPKTWCLNVDLIEEHISNKTKAIIPVHVYGNVCEMDKLIKIADSNELFIIEDAAEAMFSKYDKVFVGSLGTVGCFSFQSTKTITMGEGGAVLTNDKELNEKMRILHSHGMRQGKRYWHDFIGYNYRLTNLQAALGCAQLEKVDSIIKEKVRIYKRYLKNLSNIDGIYFQHIKNKIDPVIWAVAIRINPDFFKFNRDIIMVKLREKDIETRPGFYPFSLMPIYKAPPMQSAEQISKNIISLPSFASLSDEDIDYICKEIIDLMR